MVKKLQKCLQNTIFLSSMMGVTDSSFCVKCGQGADMVQLGALVAARKDQFTQERIEKPEYFLPESETEMISYFEKEIDIIKEKLGEIVIALNICVTDIEEGIKAGKAWEQAGGDIYELNIHGNWQNLREEGYLRGMALPAYQPRLFAWTKKLIEEDITLYLKFNSSINTNFVDLMDKLQQFDIPGYHFNIRGQKGEPRYDFLQTVIDKVETELLCSGNIRNPNQIKRLWDQGVDSVGFAQPVLDDCQFIEKISSNLGIEEVDKK